MQPQKESKIARNENHENRPMAISSESPCVIGRRVKISSERQLLSHGGTVIDGSGRFGRRSTAPRPIPATIAASRFTSPGKWCGLGRLSDQSDPAQVSGNAERNRKPAEAPVPGRIFAAEVTENSRSHCDAQHVKRITIAVEERASVTMPVASAAATSGPRNGHDRVVDDRRRAVRVSAVNQPRAAGHDDQTEADSNESQPTGQRMK